MKFLSTLLTFVALVLAAPTVLIVASWNALPGDSLYPFKKGLETITLAVTRATPLAQKFSVQFTERRFSEANKLLATQGSTVGFALLAQEARATKEIIVEKSDSQTAGELLFKIEEYQESIVTQQEALANQGVEQPLTFPAPQVLPSPQPIPEVQESVPSPAPVVTQTPTPVSEAAIEKPQATPVLLPKITEPVKAQEAVVKLEETKHDLERIKEEIKKDLPEAAQKANELREERHEKREEERQAEEEKEQKREQKERKD